MSDFEMSGSDLEQMYQEVILEAAKNPHGKEHFAPDLASENAKSLIFRYPSNGSYGMATDAPSPKPACPSWSISSKAKPWTRP